MTHSQFCPFYLWGWGCRWSLKAAWNPPPRGLSLKASRPGKKEQIYSGDILRHPKHPAFPPSSCCEAEDGKVQGRRGTASPRSPSRPGTGLGSGFLEANLRLLSNKAHRELLRIRSLPVLPLRGRDGRRETYTHIHT